MEWIDYRARIGDDGKAETLASFSTNRPRGTRYRKTPGNATLELLSKDGEVLVKENVSLAAPLQCHNYEPGYRLAEGRVPLVDKADSLQLVEGKAVLHKQSIGKSPDIKLDWPHTTVDRAKPMPLKLHLSDAADDAVLLIALEWAPGRLVGLGVHRPAKTIDINFGTLPGGPACKLHVAYTSGLRSARATTTAFTLPPVKPTGKIRQPRPKQTFLTDEVVVLEADVIPGNQAADEDVEWHINNRVVATGRHAVLNGFGVGEHVLNLVVNTTRTDSVAIKVLE